MVKAHSISRRLFLRGGIGSGAALSLAAGASGCAGQTTQPTRLAIIHTNDTHGHDILDEESLGMAAVAQLRSDYEAQGYEVLVLDAGDAAQGDNLVNRSEGGNAIDFMNAVGYDAMALGNHEFDFGQDRVLEHAEAATFPLLAANVIVEATGEPLVQERTVLELASGTKVGVFGLTTPQTYTDANPLLVRRLNFLREEELYACAQDQADALRAEGCDFVVCLAHLGEAEDAAPNRACDVAAATHGIDLIIDGHDHQEELQALPNDEGAETLIVETGCYLHAVGVVTWENGSFASELVPFGSYEGQDPEVAAVVQEAADELAGELSVVVANTAFALDGERSPGVRTHETNLGDLVCDAMLWEAQRMADDLPDCVICNGGGIRASIDAGEITLGDVFNVLPFINYVCTVQTTGADLLEALEAARCQSPEELGAFPQVSGITMTVDTRVPFEEGEEYPGSTYFAPAAPGSRVTIHDVGGRGFSPDETYVVAATDFLCAGGDTYYAFAAQAQETMASIGYLQSDCLRYYLEEGCGGEVPEEYADAAGQGRVTIIQ